MARYTPADLIDRETGQIDWIAVKSVALSRAIRDYGAPNPPPAYLRDGLRWTKDRAIVMQRQWRDANGLPDLTRYVAINSSYQKPQFSLRSAW